MTEVYKPQDKELEAKQPSSSNITMLDTIDYPTCAKRPINGTLANSVEPDQTRLIMVYTVCVNYRHSIKHGNNKKLTRHSLNWKWTGPKNSGRRVHSA